MCSLFSKNKEHERQKSSECAAQTESTSRPRQRRESHRYGVTPLSAEAPPSGRLPGDSNAWEGGIFRGVSNFEGRTLSEQNPNVRDGIRTRDSYETGA